VAWIHYSCPCRFYTVEPGTACQNPCCRPLLHCPTTCPTMPDHMPDHHDFSFPHYRFSDTSLSFYQIIFDLPCLLLLACYLVIQVRARARRPIGSELLVLHNSHTTCWFPVSGFIQGSSLSFTMMRYFCIILGVNSESARHLGVRRDVHVSG
jgi:hypothetical protein